jgi:hypothetical protein
MGEVFTAELLAEVGYLPRFASADLSTAEADIALVLRASGTTSHQRRARRGNRVLKRLLRQSSRPGMTFACVRCTRGSDPALTPSPFSGICSLRVRCVVEAGINSPI